MGEKMTAPDRDPFAFELQERLSHRNIRKARAPEKN